MVIHFFHPLTASKGHCDKMSEMFFYRDCLEYLVQHETAVEGKKYLTITKKGNRACLFYVQLIAILAIRDQRQFVVTPVLQWRNRKLNVQFCFSFVKRTKKKNMGEFWKKNSKSQVK